MSHFIVSKKEDFKKLEKSWNKLFEKNINNTSFQSFVFNFLWWELNSSNDEELFLFCYGNYKDLEFVLPCYISKNKKLLFLQSGNVDFLNAIYDPSQNNNNIFKVLSSEIKDEKKIKEVSFNNLKKDSALVHNFIYHLHKLNFYVYQSTQYSYLKLQNKNDFFLTHLDSKRRRNLRVIEQNIESSIEFHSIENNVFPINAINTLLVDMEANGIRNKESFNGLLHFVEKLYTQGGIQIMIQKSNNETVTVSVLNRLDPNTIMEWLLFYQHKKNVAIRGYIHLINFCEKNNLNLNLGTGVYDYKYVNFSPEIESLFTVHIIKNPFIFSYYFLKKTIAKALKII